MAILNTLFANHGVNEIPYNYPGGSNVMVFNNGAYDDQSSVVEIDPPMDNNGNYIINVVDCLLEGN